MVDKKQGTGQPKGGGTETPPQQPPAGSSTAEKSGGTESQGQPPAEGSTSAKRKAWIPRSATEVVVAQLRKQEKKCDELKKELAKEEGELQKLRKATELLGES